jgi:hypothetical protein
VHPGTDQRTFSGYEKWKQANYLNRSALVNTIIHFSVRHDQAIVMPQTGYLIGVYLSLEYWGIKLAE